MTKERQVKRDRAYLEKYIIEKENKEKVKDVPDNYIRAFRETDIEKVMGIWLKTNKEVHNFIEPEYWEKNFEQVREVLPLSEVYIFEDSGKIKGFAGIDKEHIEGLFVCRDYQSFGIGKKIMDFLKINRKQLTLNVYQKNDRAVKFYEREGFWIFRETFDEAVGENEYIMIWKKEDI